ncbi:hypothetical protein MTO96_040150 [Rhipicephalus appendiculatus]|uniref:Pancreatic trypsin inhibitor n=1 Tax=Rhipicephalus appendiculatus TaxID=34631 RepID=A0A131Z4N8_RHIAP
MMKAIIFTLLLISAIGRTRGSGTESNVPQCTDNGECNKPGGGPRRIIWFADKGYTFCYNISTNSCSGVGYNSLYDCSLWCLSGG